MIIKSDEPEPPKEEGNTDEDQKNDKPPEGKPADNKQPAAQAQAQPPATEQKKEEDEGEGDQKEEKEVVNQYLVNIRQMPPVDPDGNQVLVPDLIIQHNEIVDLIQILFEKMFSWISKHKEQYFKQTKVKNKELVDNNIIELDENLRAQWPRKGKLEVEVYQERKSQITAHNKKYERQIRQCLDRHNKSEDMWSFLMESISQEFDKYEKQQDKIKQLIPGCKNLAELQGASMKERDAIQSFEEKINEICDKLYDIAVNQTDVLIKLNNDMLKSCQLFKSGGNYSELEIDWYRKQMDVINDMLQNFRKEKEQEIANINDKLKLSCKEPYDKFENEYKSGMHNLIAKEGLGKKFGAPRRTVQERMRAEITK